MAARLKVFVTSDGLTDYVVAASSRPKALAAWDVRQDLFKEGKAYETQDAALREAALAQPEQVLRKPSEGRGVLEKLKPAPMRKPKAPSKAKLRKVADAEEKLTAARARENEATAELEELRQRSAAAEVALSEAAFARETAETALQAARAAMED